MIAIEEDKLIAFLKAVHHMYGYDFVEYKLETLQRRIQAHSLKLSCKSFDEYSDFVLSNKKHFEGMFASLSINVTEFFREAQTLKFFREDILDYLNSFFYVRIWYPGCSSGETAYSLAMVLHEKGLLKKSQIYATDFNNKVLKKAKEAKYPIENLELCKENYKKSGGKFDFEEYIEIDKDYFRIKEQIKEKVLFFNHNLVTDSVMNEFQLIVCQNVFIYFNAILKEKVLKLLYDSLCMNGFLVIGKNDYIEKSNLKNFKEYEQNKKVYQKCK